MLSITIYVIIFLCLLIGVLKNPSVALASLLCMYGLEQWAQAVHPLFLVHHSLTNYLVGALLLIALVRMVIKKELELSSYPVVGWLVVTLFVYSFISIQWVSVQTLSYDLWSQQFPYLVIVVLLSPFLIYSVESLYVSLKSLLIFGSVVILLLLFHAKWTYRGVELVGSSYGNIIMGNPLAVAELAGFVMLSAVLMNFDRNERVWRLLRWAIVAACLALAAKSGSRGQFMSMVVVGVVFLPISRRITNPFRFIMVICGMGILGFMGDWAYSAFTVAGDERWSLVKMGNDLSGRFENAIKLLDHWYSTPTTILFGLGNSASFDPKIIGFYPHVVPLEILGEEGIVGFLILIGIIIISIKSFVSTFYLVRDNNSARGTLAVIGAVIAYLMLLSFKQGSMLLSTYLFTFIIYLGKYDMAVMCGIKQQIELMKNEKQGS